MKFSIIVPAYQAEDHLVRCIESIVTQDFEDYEVVIVDDGSTDGTLNICRNLERKYPQVKIITKLNGGASSARNVGIRYSTGEFLLFLDSDDFWLNKQLLSTLNGKIKESDAQLILFGVRTLNVGSGKFKIRVEFSEEEVRHIEQCSPESQVEFLVRTRKFPASAWSIAVNASFIKRNEIYFEEGIVAEDIDWMISLFTEGIRVAAIEGIYHQYHKFRPGSVTSESESRAVESLLFILDRWVPRMKQPGVKEEALLQFLSFHYSTLFLSYYKVKKERRLELHNKVKNYFWLFNNVKSKRMQWIKGLLNIFGLYWGSFLLSKIYYAQLRFRV